MMTRREKLLVRPWQLRKYNNHKKKVLNAVSVVDFGPPPARNHVTIKLKKLQKEKERQSKIEEDNFKLLQHLGSIMTKKRVDNYWEIEPPTFLRRVGIYPRTRSPTPCLESASESTPENSGTRKSKCWACTPHREEMLIIPEERIPWEPPKKILTRRQSKSAVGPILSDFDFQQPIRLRETSSRCKEHSNLKSKNENKLICKKNPELPLIQEKNLEKIKGQKIVLRQGGLQVIVNFPSFAEVKLVQGKSEKYLQRNFCECTNFHSKNKKVMKRNPCTALKKLKEGQKVLKISKILTVKIQLK